MSPHLGILGYTGRMGQAIALVAREQGAAVAGGLVRAGSLLRAGGGDILLTPNPDELFPLCDVLVDFSAASAVAEHARAAARHGKAYLCGVTGVEEEARAAMAEAAKSVPVLYASNTSLSLVVMKRLVTLAARLLREQDYDIAILDRHHRWKKDAPSGTAKTLGEAVVGGNQGRHVPQYSAIRAGCIIGEHEVSFNGPGETITLTHSVTDRAIFARGAMQAALWLHGRPAGLYGMDDVLAAETP